MSRARTRRCFARTAASPQLSIPSASRKLGLPPAPAQAVCVLQAGRAARPSAAEHVSGAGRARRSILPVHAGHGRHGSGAPPAPSAPPVGAPGSMHASLAVGARTAGRRELQCCGVATGEAPQALCSGSRAEPGPPALRLGGWGYWGLGARAQGSGFRVPGAGFRVPGAGRRAQASAGAMRRVSSCGF